MIPFNNCQHIQFLRCQYLLLFSMYSKDDFRWVREVFMSNTIGLRRMGRKLDLEKDERFTFHLLERDSQVGNVTAHNVVDAIDHSKGSSSSSQRKFFCLIYKVSLIYAINPSKRVIFILSAFFCLTYKVMSHRCDRSQQEGHHHPLNVSSSFCLMYKVMSPFMPIRNFLAYKWGMEAFRIAHERVVHGRKDLLIVILKEKINVDKLPPDLRPYIRKSTPIWFFKCSSNEIEMKYTKDYHSVRKHMHTFLLISGTFRYIERSKDCMTKKKCLRFHIIYVSLKVLQ